MSQTEVVTGGRLTDWISLSVLASRVPSDAIDDAVEGTGKGERRRGGKFPPWVVACLVIALALFADEDCEEVAARLAGTFADWDGWEGSGDRTPTSSGITQARQRRGPEPLAELFTQVEAGRGHGHSRHDGDTIGRRQGSIRPRSAARPAWSGVSMLTKAGT